MGGRREAGDPKSYFPDESGRVDGWGLAGPGRKGLVSGLCGDSRLESKR